MDIVAAQRRKGVEGNAIVSGFDIYRQLVIAQYP